MLKVASNKNLGVGGRGSELELVVDYFTGIGLRPRRRTLFCRFIWPLSYTIFFMHPFPVSIVKFIGEFWNNW